MRCADVLLAVLTSLEEYRARGNYRKIFIVMCYIYVQLCAVMCFVLIYVKIDARFKDPVKTSFNSWRKPVKGELSRTPWKYHAWRLTDKPVQQVCNCPCSPFYKLSSSRLVDIAGQTMTSMRQLHGHSMNAADCNPSHNPAPALPLHKEEF